MFICWLLGELAPVSLINMHFHKFHIHMFLVCMQSFFLNTIYYDAELYMSNNSSLFPCCCKAEKDVTDFMFLACYFIVCGSICLHIIYPTRHR